SCSSTAMPCAFWPSARPTGSSSETARPMSGNGLPERRRRRSPTLRSQVHEETYGREMTMSVQPAPEKSPQATSGKAGGRAPVRSFNVPTVPQAELVELRRRVEATRFPDRETVNDATQGVQLATMEKLARYWATEYDWRKCEARLQGLPPFMTEIDGLDIHFVHVRSKHKDALPVIVTH